MTRARTAFSIAVIGVGLCVLCSLMAASKRRESERKRGEMQNATAEWENEGGPPSAA